MIAASLQAQWKARALVGKELLANGDAAGNNANFTGALYTATQAYRGAGCFVTSAGELTSDAFIPVAPDAAYVLRAAARCESGDNRIHLGLACYDQTQTRIEPQHAWRYPATTPADQAIGAVDTQIRLDPPPPGALGWHDALADGSYYVQFGLGADYADLPNFSARRITAVAKAADQWTLTITPAAGVGYAVGTPVGLTRATAAGAGDAITDAWQVFAAPPITGVNSPNETPPLGRFPSGTKYVRCCALTNLRGPDLTYIDALSLEASGIAQALRWDARAAVPASALAAPYNLRHAVPAALALHYATRAFASLTRALRWDTYAPASASLALAFDIRRSLEAALAAPWDTRALQSAALTGQWAALAALNKQLSAPYDLRASINAARALVWDTRVAIDQAAALPWAVRQLAAAQLNLRAAILAAAGRMVSVRWDARATQAAALALSWDARATQAAAGQLQWQLSGNSIVAGPAATITMPYTQRVIRIRGDYHRRPTA